MNAPCSLCAFFSDDGCEFGIDQIFADKLVVQEGDTFIQDYTCNYAFGKNTYEDNKYMISYEELKNKVISRNALKYMLFVDVYQEGFNIELAKTMLEQISFAPAVVIFMVNNNPDKQALDNFNEICTIPWRVSTKPKGITTYDVFVAAFNAYAQHQPDVLFVKGYDTSIDESMNNLHIDVNIHQKDIKENIFVFNNNKDSIYVFKECFWKNEHDWKNLINNQSEYISNNSNYISL